MLNKRGYAARKLLLAVLPVSHVWVGMCVGVGHRVVGSHLLDCTHHTCACMRLQGAGLVGLGMGPACRAQLVFSGAAAATACVCVSVSLPVCVCVCGSGLGHVSACLGLS